MTAEPHSIRLLGKWNVKVLDSSQETSALGGDQSTVDKNRPVEMLKICTATWIGTRFFHRPSAGRCFRLAIELSPVVKDPKLNLNGLVLALDEGEIPNGTRWTSENLSDLLPRNQIELTFEFPQDAFPASRELVHYSPSDDHPFHHSCSLHIYE
jgi:hypothetical protein